MAEHGIIVDQPAPRVRRIRINVPERSNALSPAICRSLKAELEAADADADIHVVIIGGTGGRSFCGGYDLSEVGSGVRDEPLQAVLSTLRSLGVPVVAAVSGHAVGAGFDLACSCDLRVARHDAKVGLPAVRLGVAYAAAGLSGIMARVPAARRLLLTGELVPAGKLAGFADVLVEGSADDTDLAALELADQLATAAPGAMAYMVAMIRPDASKRLSEKQARDWRDEILDSSDPAESARVRGTTQPPQFASRKPKGPVISTDG